MADNLTVITRSRIFNMVFNRTIMRKEGGGVVDGIAGLVQHNPVGGI